MTWYLIFGQIIHDFMDVYYTPKTSRSKKPPRDLADGLDAYWEAWGREDKKLQEMYGPVYAHGIEEEWVMHGERGAEMLKHYNLFDKKHPLFQTVIEVGVEERAWVDILGPGEQRLEGFPLLSGRIDLVVENKDGIWIVDHKALAGWADDRALDLDDQLTGYSYIWWRLSGVPPSGAYYNVLLKDPPKSPRLLANGSLSQDKSQRTTYELFLEAIKEHGLSRGDYQEYLAYLAEKGWYQFYKRLGPVRKCVEELESYERHLYYEYQRMEAAKTDDTLRQPALSQYVCPGCAFIPLCQAMEEQGNVDMVRESGYDVHPPRIEIPEYILDPTWEGV